MRALTRPLVVLTALAAVVATTLHTENASAAKTVEVPVTMDWRIGYNGVATCASWGLATWPEQEGAIGWELHYHFSPPNPAFAGERSKRLSPPFDDEEFDQFGWKPGKGTHWDGLSYSGRSSGAGNPVSCGDLQARQKALYSNVRIEITLEEDAKIVGRVRAPGGDPLAGVLVRAGGAGRDRTDADGMYEIDVPEKARRYRVRASKAGLTLRPRSRRVTVRPGRTSRANFRAVGLTIKGEVTEDCSGPRASSDATEQQCTPGVAGARVTASKIGDKKTYAVRTTSDGRYVMLVQEKGRYVIKFSVDGKTWTQRRTLRRNNVTVNQDIGNRNTGAPITR